MSVPDPAYATLAASRRDWIAGVLVPWCRQARRLDLLQAEADWPDLAGRVDPEKTLWAWAWGRFDAFAVSGLDETRPVLVTPRDGGTATGFPDARASRRGRLVLVALTADGGTADVGPFDLDDILAITLPDGPNEPPAFPASVE